MAAEDASFVLAHLICFFEICSRIAVDDDDDDDDRKFEPRGGTDGGWASRNDNLTWHGPAISRPRSRV